MESLELRLLALYLQECSGAAVRLRQDLRHVTKGCFKQINNLGLWPLPDWRSHGKG